MVLASGPKLTVDDLPIEITEGQNGRQDERRETSDVRPRPDGTVRPEAAPTSLADGERAQILAALERCRGNKSKAAVELGISRRTILRKLKEWGLE